MKIYTKTGDAGETGLLGAARVSKADPRIQCLGEVDELNASLGYLRSQIAVAAPPALAKEVSLLLPIQKRLFEIGATVADVRRDVSTLDLFDATIDLEQSIDRQTAWLPPLTSFILPAGTPQSSFAHVTRSICRRAERALVAVLEGKNESQNVRIQQNLSNAQIYLNRLSDWLFVLARSLNHVLGQPDEPWPG
ncbi:MAG: cob(I)yrinic acid a,c-diamide adenosyltransferase [Planctomycetaceae bacterium]|nr:cob(I)yrinic acid a,c-diamide adenosyltransferase [Planctomycetaceae bacterium]